MRRPAILMLVLSVFLGVLAVYLARDWVQDQVSAAKKVETKQVNLTTVVVAKRPLHFGDELSSSALEEVSWPVRNVPPGSFTAIGQLLGKGERRVVLKTIQVNEPVLKTKISGFGGRATLSTVIDKELRAVTVRVNDVNGVAGFVLPGDRVDLLLTRQPKDTKEQITDVLMQNIKVLGIDQDASEDKDKPKVVRAVTLEVTTEESQKLTLAQTVGQLALTLRSATNNEPISHRRIRERDLVDDRLVKDRSASADRTPERAPAPVKKAIRVVPHNTHTTVRVYRGLEPKVHEVSPEAATPKLRVTRSVTQPKATKNAGDGGAGAGKVTGDADRVPPVPAGPTRLLPDAPRNEQAPKAVPGFVPDNTRKPGGPTVNTGPLAG